MAKKLTIEEKRHALEEQLAELEVLGEVEEEIKELISRYEENIRSELTETYQDGFEPEQDKSWEGELRWEIPEEVAKRLQPDKKYPRTVWNESELLAVVATLEEAEAKPYHAPHWESRPVTFEDASEWTKNRVRKYRKLVEILKGIEVA